MADASRKWYPIEDNSTSYGSIKHDLESKTRSIVDLLLAIASISLISGK